MVEKRKSSRIGSVNLLYICLDREDQVVHQAMGKTCNLSEGGFLIETHFHITTDHTLAASIGLQDEIVEIRGRVVHSETAGAGKYLAGIQITEIIGDKAIWHRFIKNNGGESEPAVV